MYGTITKIEYGCFKDYDGIIIETSQESTIKILIENKALCCENWGYNINNIDIITPSTKLHGIISSLNGLTVLGVDYNIHRHPFGINQNVIWSCFDIICINRLKGYNPEIYEIDVWCENTSYYPHDLYTEWFDHKDTHIM
jgi:hypothetical protein